MFASQNLQVALQFWASMSYQFYGNVVRLGFFARFHALFISSKEFFISSKECGSDIQWRIGYCDVLESKSSGVPE